MLLHSSLPCCVRGGNGIESDTKRTIPTSQFFSLEQENSETFQCPAISISNTSGLEVQVETGQQKETSGHEIWRKYSFKGLCFLNWGRQLLI